MTTLWTEKYRPKFFISQEHPHVLLHGQPSTGKTTYAHQIARPPVIEINASNDRGIQMIRSLRNTTNHTIILDECDNLTVDAQQCLRRIIETSNNRFIFIANYLSKIILPLRSRLYIIKFECGDMLHRLCDIANAEHLKVDVEYIYKHSGYDTRRTLNVMQALSPICNNLENSTNNDDIYALIDNFLGIIPANVMQDFEKLTADNLDTFVSYFVDNSFSLTQLIRQILCINCPLKFFGVISEVEEMCVRGVDTEVLLHYLCSSYVQIKNQHVNEL